MLLGECVDYRHVASAPAVSLRTIHFRDGEKVEYIHLNPVRRRLEKNAEDWKWSMREFAVVSGEDQEQSCGFRIDRVPLPFDVRAHI
jgi:hypothetical protein